MRRLMIAMLALPFLAAGPAWAGVRCVAFGLPACDTSVCTSGCYSSPQTAVAAALDGDEIRIAEGTYTPPVNTTFTFGSQSYSTRQVVLVNNKSLILRGGYTASDFTHCDPVANPTIVDGAHSGRGVTVIGPAAKTVALSGLTIRNGDYSGLGNAVGESHLCPKVGEADCGGGLWASTVRLVLEKVKFFNNTTGNTAGSNRGDGALLWELAPGSMLSGCYFQGNTSLGTVGHGGGLYAFGCYGMDIENTEFILNQANGEGGGCYIHGPWQPLRISGVDFFLNSATGGKGGGLALRVANYPTGPVVVYDRGNLALNGTEMLGAAIYVEKYGTAAASVMFSNLLIGQNSTVSTDYLSSDVYILNTAGDFEAGLYHVTAYSSGVKTFAYGVGCETGGYGSVYNVNNSVLSDYDRGLLLYRYVSGGAVTGRLHYSVLDDVTFRISTVGSLVQTSTTGSVDADPLLDGSGRPQFASPVRDMCPDTYVTGDLDGMGRDAWPDAGAYEYVAYRLNGPFELLLE